MKVYTKNGDLGKTSLVDGSSVTKSNPRLDSYGGVDELNSQIGVLVAGLKQLESQFEGDIAFLTRIQNELFDLGSQLACADEALKQKLPQVTEAEIKKLETEMDLLSEDLPVLKNFILPGGHPVGAQAHVCRSVCRRVERDCVGFLENLTTASESDPVTVPYLNRLSDYFFVLSRSLNLRLKYDTPLWAPKK